MSRRKIWILTLFPDFFEAFLKCGVVGTALRGENQQSFEVKLVQIRDYSVKDYKGVDDAPFGGGPGMVMRADVLKNALFQGVIIPGNYGENYKSKVKVIIPSPRGKKWQHLESTQFAREFLTESSEHDLIFICGRYEGMDERFIQNYVDLEYSVGDYILSGGEIAVMAILDSSLRHVKGVLGNDDSVLNESFDNDLLEWPQFTRPREFENIAVPEILLSGHHEKIKKWQLAQRIEVTKKFRPDLWDKYAESSKMAEIGTSGKPRNERK